jgi:hypothetical protein
MLVACRRDNTEFPFAPDPRLQGTWKGFAFAKGFTAEIPKQISDVKWLKKIEVFPDGRLDLHAEDGRERHFKWTNGFIYFSGRAMKYEIKKIQNKEYLFLEWKSDLDWALLRMPPDTFILVRN